MEKYPEEKRYKGEFSACLNEIKVSSLPPKSGRIETVEEALKNRVIFPETTMTQYKAIQNERLCDVRKWQTNISKAAYDALNNESPEIQNAFPPYGKGKGCNLYVKFQFSDEREKRLDLDNLLKPVLDALKPTKIYKEQESLDELKPVKIHKQQKFRGLVQDDNYFTGIKVFKDVRASDCGLSLKCITTQTFTIEKVEPIKGEELMPNYWHYDMQLITAKNEQGEGGIFIDNLPGRIFITREKDKNYPDSVPGYPWKKGKVNGCMTFERKHGDEEKTFSWLNKWTWW